MSDLIRGSFPDGNRHGWFSNTEDSPFDGTNMTATYKFHEVCERFPAMLPEEFAGLVERIRKFGQRDYALRYGGEIIDGKHRVLAALEAGVEPKIQDYRPKATLPKDIAAEIHELALDKNIHRRHMTPSQRAQIIAPDVTTDGKGRPKLNAQSCAFNQNEAAEKAGVSRRTIQDAVTVENNSPPEVIAAVIDGAVSVADAASVADLPKSEQIAAVKKVRKKKAKTLKKATEPKNAAAVRRNGKMTVKGKEIIEEQVTKAFGSVVRLIDRQATDCDCKNTAMHRAVCDQLNTALESFKSFTKECRQAIARK